MGEDNMDNQMPNFEADRMFFEADQQIKDGKPTEAMDQLLQIIEQYPTYGKAYNHIGFIYETRYRDYKKAEEYYQKALEYSPDYPATYLNYALVLSTMEKFEELESLVKRGLEVPGASKDRLYNEMGIMSELKEKYEEAIVYFKKAVKYSLSESDIEIYKKNITRCRRKEEMEFF